MRGLGKLPGLAPSFVAAVELRAFGTIATTDRLGAPRQHGASGIGKAGRFRRQRGRFSPQVRLSGFSFGCGAASPVRVAQPEVAKVGTGSSSPGQPVAPRSNGRKLRRFQRRRLHFRRAARLPSGERRRAEMVRSRCAAAPQRHGSACRPSPSPPCSRRPASRFRLERTPTGRARASSAAALPPAPAS